MVTAGHEHIESCGGEDIITLEKNERLAAGPRPQPDLTASRPGVPRRTRWASVWRTISAAVRTITKWRLPAIGVFPVAWEHLALVPGELQGDVWFLYLARDLDVSGRRY